MALVAGVGCAKENDGDDLLSDGETAWMHTDLAQVTDLLPEGTEWIQAPFDVWRDAGW